MEIQSKKIQDKRIIENDVKVLDERFFNLK